MSIVSGALSMGRTLAESLMTDTVRVFRRTESGDFDDVTGEPAYTDTELYEGPGRLVLRSSVVRDVDAGHQLQALQGPRLDLPVEGTDDIESGARFEVTASASDSALVGVSGVVSGGFPQTYATARRLPVEVSG